jgi:hypothetical protein
MALIVLTSKEIAGFEYRVNKEGPDYPGLGRCWLWQDTFMQQGYGRWAGTLAHRYSWVLYVGEIPDGLSVLHRCDNPPCVNPAHLFLGTQQDNLADMREKGHQVRGELQGGAILTEELVRAIRKRYRRYSHVNGTGAIARDLGVSLITIWKVVMRHTWDHVK